MKENVRKSSLPTLKTAMVAMSLLMGIPDDVSAQNTQDTPTTSQMMQLDAKAFKKYLIKMELDPKKEYDVWKRIVSMCTQDEPLSNEMQQVITNALIRNNARAERGGPNMFWRYISRSGVLSVDFLKRLNKKQLDLIAEGFKHKGHVLWWAVKRGNASEASLAMFTNLQLVNSFDVGAAVWGAVAAGKVSQEFLSRFSTRELSLTFKRGASVYKALSTGAITEEFLNKFTPAELAGTLRGGGIWNAIRYGHLSEDFLKKKFTSEQLSKTFRYYGGRFLHNVLSGKLSEGFISTFSSAQLDMAIKYAGTYFMNHLSTKQIGQVVAGDSTYGLRFPKSFIQQLTLPGIARAFVQDSVWFMQNHRVIMNNPHISNNKEELYTLFAYKGPIFVAALFDVTSSVYRRGKESENGMFSKEIFVLFEEGIKRAAKAAFTEDMSQANPNENRENSFNILMRIINHFHGSENTHLRDEIIGALGSSGRYWLSVHGRSEVFTSTSTYTNYILPKIREDIVGAGGLSQYLAENDKSQKGVLHFIGIFARYGQLEQLLSLGSDTSETLDVLFNLPEGDSEAISTLAGVFWTLHKNDSTEILKTLERKMIEKYKATESQYHKRAYGVVISLYYSMAGGKMATKGSGDFFKQVHEEVDIVLPNKLFQEQLFTKEGGKLVHRQVWFFLEGGDRDGVLSRQSAEEYLTKRQRLIDAGFKRVSAKDDVLVYRREFEDGRVVEIIFSKIIKVSKPEISDRLKSLIKGKYVHHMVYRGHSTYVPQMARILVQLKSKNILTNTPSSFALGSCGGTSSIVTIASSFKKPLNFFFSTSGTGSTTINGPLMTAYAVYIGKNGSFNSEEFKRQADERFKIFGSLYEAQQFPHTNLPAIIHAHMSKKR